jgi:hypothetical protein
VRVLICGSRDWKRQEPIYCVLNGYAADDMPVVVLHGGAPGADSIASVWAHLNRERVTGSTPAEPLVLEQVWPADWEQHGKAAGPIRNQRMIDEGNPTTVWAFTAKPLAESRGTADMVTRARKAGIPVYVVEGPA